MLLLLLTLASVQVEQCGLCHPEERVQFEASIHSQELIRCSDCHGGDPESVSVDQAHNGDFRDLKRRADIPEHCASCHSDPVQMRVYNLPTDQYALYRTSGHGILLEGGRTDIAVCTDCHGIHRILKSADSQSSTFVRNIPATCGRCHGEQDETLTGNEQSNLFQDYVASVHGRELLEKGNTSAPECSRCHGIHGATPAGVGDVSKMCGNCHTSALRAFRDSPHAVAMMEAGIPECIACHENHATEPSDYHNLAEICLDCHDQDSSQHATGKRMEVLFARAQEETDKALDRITEAESIPLFVEDHYARLEQARTYLLEAEPAIHSVSLSEVERFTRAARSMGEEIEAEIEGELVELRLRRLGLVVFWFYLLLTIWILYHYRQNALKEEE
jgi:hypothetical protein